MIALLQADYNRFVKYGYGTYTGYVENIAKFFKIILSKPKKKEKKKQ